MMKEIAKLLGLPEDASDEEIEAKIKESQKETENLKKANQDLVETNKNLTVSEAGKQARIDELEKEHKQLLESSSNDNEKLAEM